MSIYSTTACLCDLPFHVRTVYILLDPCNYMVTHVIATCGGVIPHTVLTRWNVWHHPGCVFTRSCGD